LFTGLIHEIAQVISLKNDFLTLKAKYTPKFGDSIAINGACLTVINLTRDTFTVQLSFETQKIVAMENYKDMVHIEPSMMAKDRFEGHIVQGHVDCLGIIKSIVKVRNCTDFIISLPNEYIKYIVPKGSIAVNGVSLTINEVMKNSFRLTIIPYTIDNTLFKRYKIGTKVNLETDMFARYTYNMLKKKEEPLTWDKVNGIMSSY